MRLRIFDMKVAVLYLALLIWLAPIAANAFTIAPATMDFIGARGMVLDGTLLVSNTDTQAQTFYFGTLKFEPEEDGITPRFIPFDQDHSGIGRWIEFPASIEIAGEDEEEVAFRIHIPKNASAQTYYVAVTVSTAPSELIPTAGATVQAKTAALVFVTVQGDNTEKLVLLDANGPSAASGLPATISYRVQNQGTVLVVPNGTLTWRDLFSRTVVELPVNEAAGRVLPGSTRAFDVGWGTATSESFWSDWKAELMPPRVGPFRWSLDIGYGSSKQTLAAQGTTWFIPWRSLLTLGVLIAIASRARSRL